MADLQQIKQAIIELIGLSASSGIELGDEVRSGASPMSGRSG
jgi:hypothetical protein